MTAAARAGMGAFARASAGELIIQPRMGMSAAKAMAAGIRAVAKARARTAATITVDSYTRTGDYESARQGIAARAELNGFPIVAHGPAATARVATAATGGIPVQVRHGSACPGPIFATMAGAGLTDSEGGPVSYCLPYGRTPLAESVARWADATGQLAADCRARELLPHLETFGGCLLGQLCPPSLLVAMSLLEGLFFVQHGVTSISLSYAQQTDPVQDIEALTALRQLGGALLPAGSDWHLVLYTYMGAFPRTAKGALSVLSESVDIAVRGCADRLIVKTVAEAYRIPTVAENVTAIEWAAEREKWARQHSGLPTAQQVDFSGVLAEASRLIEAVLELSDDVGLALLRAFRSGLLDVPFCLHRDNRGLTQGAIDDRGRLVWARLGRLPLRASARPDDTKMTSGTLLRMLRTVADRHDQRAVQGPAPPLPRPLVALPSPADLST